MPIATASRSIIAFVIGAPIIGVIAIYIILISKGYSPLEYPGLIADGRLSWWKQFAGWAGGCLWIGFFWPRSLAALKEPRLIREEGEYIIVADWPEPIGKAEIEEAEVKSSLGGRELVLRKTGGERIRQSAFLFKQDVWEVADRLRNISGARGT